MIPRIFPRTEFTIVRGTSAFSAVATAVDRPIVVGMQPVKIIPRENSVRNNGDDDDSDDTN